MKYKSILAAFAVLAAVSCTESTDLLIVGGGASGTAAGIQASRMGTKTMIVEETPWLGGMLTSAGVSATDGNYKIPSGIWGEFQNLVAQHYGGFEELKTGWVSNIQFEPSVGNEIFKTLCEKEENLTVIHGWFIDSVEKNPSGRGWTAHFKNEEGKTKVIKAKLLIDATELGDLIPLTGAGYDLGMESRNVTGEDIAPEEANHIVQDLTYCMTLKDYGYDVSIQEPEDYDPMEFAACCDNKYAFNPKEPDRLWSKDDMISYGKLPNGKYMINWPIEGNDFYVNIVEMSREERIEALKAAKGRSLRFLYFLQHELGLNTLGLADDEFDSEDLLPYIPYHRESRRVHGLVRFTLNHISDPYGQSQPLYRTSIAVGDYPVDHHHTRYDGEEELPNLYFYAVPSYGVPMGVLLPLGVEDLVVAEKSVSVSNIVNGTTRLQPVVLQIGQVAGIISSLALKEGVAVSEVNVRDVQDAMLAAGGYILPYLDVTKDSPAFKSYQRIGATGLLHGEGRNVDWANQTWIRATDQLLHSELEPMAELYGLSLSCTDNSAVSLEEVVDMISKCGCEDAFAEAVQTLKEYGFAEYDPARVATRGEFAVLVDALLDPFHQFKVGIDGNIQ